MGVFIRNMHIKCTVCGYGSIIGKENSHTNENGSIYKECRWVCPRCNNMFRLDKKIIPVSDIKLK